MAVEPSPCPSIFQDLAESGPLEPEAAPVSSLHMRVARALKFLFQLCKSSRKISKRFGDVRIHSGLPIRNKGSARSAFQSVQISIGEHRAFSSVVLPEQVPMPSRSEPTQGTGT